MNDHDNAEVIALSLAQSIPCGLDASADENQQTPTLYQRCIALHATAENERFAHCFMAAVFWRRISGRTRHSGYQHQFLRQIIATVEYNLEQLDSLTVDELEILKATVTTLIEHTEQTRDKKLRRHPKAPATTKSEHREPFRIDTHQYSGT